MRWPKKIVVGDSAMFGKWWAPLDPAFRFADAQRIYVLQPKRAPRRGRKGRKPHAK